MRKIRYTNFELTRDLNSIKQQLKGKHFISIVAIGKGGLILSSKLGLHLHVGVLEIKGSRQNFFINELLPLSSNTGKVLVVVDLCKSRYIWKEIIKFLRDRGYTPYIIALHTIKKARSLVNLSINIIEKERIMYPWEKK